MPDQETINMIGGAVLAALGWFARVLYDDVREMQRKHADLREHIADQYAKKDDLREAVQTFTAQMNALGRDMRDGFDRIFQLLDDKADKE